MELKLDEQTFTIGPEEDNLMIFSTSGFDVTSHFTSDGEVEPPLLVTPGNIVSFYIYHGTGGLNFSYELSVEPYATSGIPALRKRHAISTRGFDFSVGGSASRA